eukprot:365447-Chlamydomonas_euryale.AAC.20
MGDNGGDDSGSAAPGASGGAFSFGFTKKATVRKKVAVQVAEEGPAAVQLSAVESGGVFRTLDGRDAATLGQAGKKTLVIPKIENTYQAGRGFGGGPAKFTPSFKPPAADAPVHGEGADKFELAAPTAAMVTAYGLQHVRAGFCQRCPPACKLACPYACMPSRSACLSACMPT